MKRNDLKKPDFIGPKGEKRVFEGDAKERRESKFFAAEKRLKIL